MAAVVQRYIDDCHANHLSRTKIKNGLARDIYGIEIDGEQYEKCIKNLNEILKKNDIENVDWKIINEDYLKWDSAIQFHYIVGNPPYITYQELEETDRDYVRNKFVTCEKGKFDYCYAFIEKSIDCLKPDGKMSYLIPSTLFKTVFGEKLRTYIKPYLCEIYDYTQQKVFDNALVKSAIVVIDKGIKQDKIFYYDVARKEKLDILRTDLSSKWFFTQNNKPGTRRFGDFFQVSHVVATLLNDAFVLKKDNYKEIDGFYICNEKKIEKTLVRDTATPRSLRYKKTEKIIFPYDYKNGKLVRYTEKQFSSLFPEAEKYLSDFREELDERVSDNNALWFEYGRSQALSNLNKRKLLISTIITEKVVEKLHDFGVLCRVGRNPYPTHCFNLLTDNTNKAAKIQCALFKGTTRDIFIDRKEFDGPIYEQVDDAYNFVLRHIDMGAEIEGVYRNDDYELPISAIRGIIANAVLHRSYLDKSCVQVCIYDDRLEVASPGMLYGGLDIETAKKGKSSCRNVAIAEAFHYMHIVEAWGTGLPRILNRCKEYGLPEPLFEEFGDGFKVTLFRKVSNAQEKMSEVDDAQIKNERSQDVNAKNERSLSEVLSGVLSTSEYNKVEKIIHYLEINRSITPKIAEEITGKSAPTVRRYLRMLVETGYVNTDGKTNNVRYVI